ncbi:MAG: helix-turn-helix domain-containing protein [Acholeplasmataceae bacterium]|nr:helix-turn-helix domain-containing protein [Acholeplasmataceae bacterium]
MSAKDAAEYLGVSRQRVSQLIKVGKLKVIGNAIDYNSVVEYLSTRRNGRPLGSFKKRG